MLPFTHRPFARPPHSALTLLRRLAQEVSAKWAGGLHAYFARSGYHLVHASYGGRLDGYMGVALAFPLSK